MIRFWLLITMLCACAAAPVSAGEPPTYYFVFEVDEARLAERMAEEGRDEIDLNAAIEAAMDVAARRIGGDNYELRNLGEGRIALTLTHENAPQAARDVFGITARLDFLLVDIDAEQDQLEAGVAPPGTIILPHPDGNGLLALRTTGGLSGDRLTDVRSGIDPQTGQPVITLGFDFKGKEQLATLTRANINKPMAIVIDGKVLSAPTILEPILEGQVQISGGFTQKGANELAIRLRSGALPASFKLVEERRLETVP